MKDLFYNFSLTFLLALGLIGTAEAQGKKDAGAKAQTGEGTSGLEAGSDYVCEATVHYSWKKQAPATPPAPGDKAPAPLQQLKDEQSSKKEYYTTAGEQGQVEAEVKARLESKLPALEREALDECRELHQNISRCLDTRLAKERLELQRLDYATRKAAQENILKTCQAQAGQCEGTEVSAIACRIERPSDLPKAEASEAPKGGKGK